MSSPKEKQLKEHLEQAYGKQAFVSKKWLEKECKRLGKKPALTAKATPQSTAKGPPQIATKISGSLEEIRTDLGDCQRCKLCKTRTNIVFGEGSPKAELMFVGEGPGEQEDLKGRPFVGRAGQLLDKIIEAMGLKRADVYIANVVKCRPPNNRVPEPDEVSTCSPFLMRQIEAIKPKIIVALGSTALKRLVTEDIKITKTRGQFMDYMGTKLMPTFHPAYLLRNPPAKKDVWEDMQKVMKELNITPSGRA